MVLIVSKSNKKKEQLMLEYKKARRIKTLTILAIVIISAGILTGIGFAIYSETQNPAPAHGHDGGACGDPNVEGC
jgi:hypothetical protein